MSAAELGEEEEAKSPATESGPLVKMPAGTTLPVTAPDTIMSKKAHGTCSGPLQKELRWGCSHEVRVVTAGVRRSVKSSLP